MLKSGKNIKTPALFVNVRTKKEAHLLKETINRYPVNKNLDGLNQIDGIVVSIKDHHAVSPFLVRNKITDFAGKYSTDERSLIIDPSCYLPFMGLDQDKEAFCKTVSEWIPELQDKVNQITVMESQKSKIEEYMKQIYPLLDVRLIQGLLEFQMKNHADFLVCPSVPLSSPRKIKEQIKKMADMNREGGVLINTILKKYEMPKDSMNMVALNPSVLAPEYFEEIRNAMMQGNPNMLGIRLMNLDEKDVAETKTFLKFLKELEGTKIPIFVFNVREFGYVCLCHGASVISMPIARSPYTTRTKGTEKPVREGTYYHPIDMIDYQYARLRDEIRSNNYRFPCHCEACESFGILLKVDKKIWNDFRKIHFLLLKDMEIKEFRETNVDLKVALQDKFGRSKRTSYITFLD
jgi:hypothetical protein